MFKTLLKSLSKKFTAHSIPFPILLLTKDFEDARYVAHFDGTIDVFPIKTIPTKLLDYLL
jgi:hypothetical protein